MHIPELEVAHGVSDFTRVGRNSNLFIQLQLWYMLLLLLLLFDEQTAGSDGLYGKCDIISVRRRDCWHLAQTGIKADGRIQLHQSQTLVVFSCVVFPKHLLFLLSD